MNIVGHKKIIDFLENSIRKNVLSHAYLFSGPEHVGKFTVAREFSKQLSGNRNFEVNPDIIVIRPEIREKKGIIKKLEIKVGDIREMERKLNLTHLENSKKIAIIDDAEFLGRSAQNALLKTLEEPAKDAIVILVAHDRNKLLPTIISRVQEKKFNLIENGELEKMIGSGKGGKEKMIYWSMGRPGVLAEMMLDPGKMEEKEAIKKNLLEIFRKNACEKIEIAEKLSKDTVALEKIIDLWIWTLWKEDRVNFGLIEKMAECRKTLRNTNANAKLVLENLLLSF